MNSETKTTVLEEITPEGYPLGDCGVCGLSIVRIGGVLWHQAAPLGLSAWHNNHPGDLSEYRRTLGPAASEIEHSLQIVETARERARESEERRVALIALTEYLDESAAKLEATAKGLKLPTTSPDYIHAHHAANRLAKMAAEARQIASVTR